MGAIKVSRLFRDKYSAKDGKGAVKNDKAFGERVESTSRKRKKKKKKRPPE